MTENEILGVNLLRLRKEKQCSQEWAANTMEMSHVELRTLEHGIGNPQLDTIQKAAKFYETTVVDLLTLKKE